MKYVVSGSRRTGTSMMVKALHVGGLPALYDKSMEKPSVAGYNPNPGGLYEIGYANAMTPGYLRAIPDGVVVKIMWDGLVNLPRGEWTIIFMERDPEEINASCQRVDEYLKSSGVAEQDTIQQGIAGLPFSCFRTYNQGEIDHVIGIMEARIDVRIVRVAYQEVLDDPIRALKRIKYTPIGKERLPIDIEKAASVIDSRLRRVRV